MIAIAYTLSFCFLGAQMIRWLMPRKSPLVRAWLGVSLGVLMEMGLPALCANALDFTVAAHIAAVAAALLLGARDAFACDIDDKCVGVAYENAALNGIGREHYTVRAGDVLSDKRLAREFGGDYDIVVANIVADVIIALAPQVRPLLKKGGLFLCSGIIDDRAVEAADALRLAGWAIMEARESEGWFSYLCQ